MKQRDEFTDGLHSIIEAALNEDLGDLGDLTSALLIPDDQQGRARIVAKEGGTIAGLDLAEAVFRHVDAKVEFQRVVQDGDDVGQGDLVAKIAGSLQSILTAERTALNFLQRLSGIATLTRKFVERIRGTKARVLDTRKTTPGLRRLEKYAVAVGGGVNHRMGLFDMILIKDNHIVAAGSISEAVSRARQGRAQDLPTVKIEVEAGNLNQVRDAVELQVDRIMLDNMSLEDMRAAVQLAAGRVELEASGNVTMESIAQIAETGVDFVSVGALTHSAKALDLSLLIQ